MGRKIYRTAQGRMVDLGALQLQNEHVRSVGNMGVNARGDLLDSDNRPMDSRNRQVATQYKKQTTNTSRTPVASSSVAKTKPVVEIPTPPEDFEDDFEKIDAVQETSQAPAEESGGLAAAIARAREVRQVPIAPPPRTIKKI